MFDQFREKLQSVQHDLSTGLKSLSAKAQMVGKTARFPDDFSVKTHSIPSLKNGLHIKAGAELLQKFQKQWQDIHMDIESSAAIATQADEKLRKLINSNEQKCELWLQLQKQLTDLPSMVTEIQKITASLGKLTAEFEEVESLILEFEDALEEVDHHSNKLAQQEELQRYKGQKLAEQKILRERMHEEFKGKIKQLERQEEAKQKERQKAFEEFFVADMQHYKTHGKVEISVEIPQHQTYLEDLDIVVDEEDQQALNDFLESGSDDLTLTPTGSVVTEGNSAHEDSSSDDDKPPPVIASTVESDPEEIEDSSDYSRESEDVTAPGFLSSNLVPENPVQGDDVIANQSQDVTNPAVKPNEDALPDTLEPEQ